MKLIAAILLFCELAFGSVVIYHDKNACVDGHSEMEVNVYVSGELFEFQPKCDEPFSRIIRTSRGVRCSVDSGMCSQYAPTQRFVVNCLDDYRDSVVIFCP